MTEIITVLSQRTIKLQSLESNLLISYLSTTESMRLQLPETQKLNQHQPLYPLNIRIPKISALLNCDALIVPRLFHNRKHPANYTQS